MKEQLLEKIQELFPFYTDYYTIFLNKQAEVQAAKKKIEEGKDLPDPDDLEKMLLDNYVDLALFSQDLQFIYTRLVYYLDLYVEIAQEDVPVEMQELYKNYKALYPAINFIVKDGKLIEREEGSLEKKRIDFLQSENYKQLTKMFT